MRPLPSPKASAALCSALLCSAPPRPDASAETGGFCTPGSGAGALSSAGSPGVSYIASSAGWDWGTRRSVVSHVTGTSQGTKKSSSDAHRVGRHAPFVSPVSPGKLHSLKSRVGLGTRHFAGSEVTGCSRSPKPLLPHLSKDRDGPYSVTFLLFVAV